MRMCGVFMTLAISGCLSTPSRPEPNVQGVLFGDTREEGCDDGHPAGLAEASSFVAPGDGVVTNLGMQFAGGHTRDVVIALYDNALDHPGTLITSATFTQTEEIDRIQLDAVTTSQPAITKGTVYWIAAFCPFSDGGDCAWEYTYDPGGDPMDCFDDHPCDIHSSSCTEHSMQADLETPPAMWTSGDTFGRSVNAFFALDLR